MVYRTTSQPNDPTRAPDDAPAILADCRALYLKLLGQLLQTAEKLPPPAIQLFAQAVGGHFDDMVSTSRRSGFEGARGLTASRISLVHETQLELDIRLGELSAGLTDSAGGDLWRVYLRFLTLLGRPDLNTADNPVGPKGIALGLAALAALDGEDHERTLDRIDRLESQLVEDLPGIYVQLNDLLATRNVAASQPLPIVSAETAGMPSPAPAPQPPNAAAALHQQLLGPAGSAGAGGGFSAPGAVGGLLSQAALSGLLARLEQFERNPGAAGGGGATGDVSLESLIPGLFAETAPAKVAGTSILDAGRLGIPDGAPEAAGIDTLGRIFERILAARDLPDAVKASLASLQVPTAKAALLDPAFFGDARHPARRLLDRIARLALGLPLAAAPRHPVCAAIADLAARLRRDFGNDLRAFAPALARLDSLITERDAAADRTGEAYLPLLYQLDRRKQAELRARELIEQRLALGAPDSIATFLRKQWQKVLLISWMEGGEQGSAWQENSGVIGDLLWSILPKTEIDDRKRLAKILPPMLQRLNAGMTRIGIPAAEQEAFLDLCFALQTAAMRRTPETPAEAIAAPPLMKTGAPTISELSAGELLLQIVDHADSSLPAVSRLGRSAPRPGQWLDFQLGDEAPRCGRLAQISPTSGMLLLANPDWDFAVALHPHILDSLLKLGTARLVSQDSLFDRAAEQALHRAPAA